MPPQNLEAEESVLGSVLLDNDVYAQIEGRLTAAQFYKESHRKIFRAMERLARRAEPIDLVTLTEELRQTGELEGVGSVPYLIGLADSVPTAAYAENYAKIVAEKATLRDLISTSGEIMQTAYDQAQPLEQILDKAESRIFELATSKRKHAFLGMGSLVSDTFAYINELFGNDDPVSGLRTGFKELDSITAGLQPSSLNVLAARPSMGKCLGKGTKVVMYGGMLKPVEELEIGDLLLGPDSSPRQVLSLARGREMMYWVRQRHGIDYRVNASHIVSLKRSRNPDKGEVVNLSVREWLARSPKFQNTFKGYKVGVEFPETPTTVEPYFLGLWLGDGATCKVRVAAADQEIVSYLYDYAARLDMIVSVDAQGGHCPSYAITRGCRGGAAADREASLQGQLAALGVLGDKHIPKSYLLTSRPRRLELLAGLIDADGHYLANQNGSYEITTKRENLARQIKYLCDTLGYRTSLTSRRASLKREDGTVYHCEVYRVRFNGDMHAIPVRVPRKRAKPWSDGRDWRVTGVTVEADSIDDYYGFTLSGDGLFLLEDMTVTHNTAFALTIGQNAALRSGQTIGIFSLEMSGVQLVTRMLCSEARVDMSRVRNGQLSDRDFQRLADTAGKMAEAKIFIDDAADMSIMELRSRARRLMAEHSLGLIIIDYLQLMSAGGRGGFGENRQQEISTISRGLKALARELDIPVLVLSQLSRAVESRPNKRPMLSDLRECVTGDTLVVLADGRRLPIRKLVGTTPDVVAVTLEGGLVSARSDKVWRVGERPVFALRLASGRVIRATAKHRLLSFDGWRRVAELKVGERLALARFVLARQPGQAARPAHRRRQLP
jgi:replicative DNA helicase